MRENFYKVYLHARGDSLSKKRQLDEWQSKESDEIQREQERRLQDILKYAYDNVPYYRNNLDRDVLKEDSQNLLENYENTPILEKKDLRENYDSLISECVCEENCRVNSSGGSTGEPVEFLQDKTHINWEIAIKHKFNEWSGYNIGEPRIRLWGADRDLKDRPLIDRIIWWARNEKLMNAFNMSVEDMGRYIDIINTHQPSQILAYPESIYELSKHIRSQNASIWSPNAVMTSAGTLHPHMRETIQSVFNTEIFDRYGSREMGDMASECICHDGLHISPLSHYIEIVDENGNQVEQGEMGEVVVTSLVNRAMPLIRYRIGDLAVRGDSCCDCGINWPKIQDVTGRVTDVFEKKDGSIISPEYFIHQIGVESNPEGLYKFQVVQEDFNTVNVNIELESGYESLQKEDTEEIREIVREVMSNCCKVSVLIVDEIEPTPTGKHRYTRSKVR